MENITADADTLQLYQDQLDALDFFEHHLNNHVEIQENLRKQNNTKPVPPYTCVVAGYAGTGKSTLIPYFVSMFRDIAATNKTKIGAISMTNKAVGRIMERVKRTGVNLDFISTIHSFLYSPPKEKNKQADNPDTTQVKSKNEDDEGELEWIISEKAENLFLIIDEFSMVTKKLEEDLYTKCTTHNVFILYLGDSFQLEPIGKKSNIEKLPTFTMTEVKRQDGLILNYVTEIRKRNSPILPDKSKTDPFELHIANSKEEIMNNFEMVMGNHAKPSIALIVATNKVRVNFNNAIRKRLGFDKFIIHPKDQLISVANSNRYSNGDIFNYNVLFAGCTQVLMEKLTFSIYNKKTYEFDDYTGTYFYSNETEDSLLLFPDLMKPSIYHGELSMAANITDHYRLTKMFNEVHDAGGMVKHYMNKKVVIGTFGYAISAHKSQGSEFETVMVYFNYCAPTWQAARWFYTACTRAQLRLVILPSKVLKPR